MTRITPPETLPNSIVAVFCELVIQVRGYQGRNRPSVSSDDQAVLILTHGHEQCPDVINCRLFVYMIKIVNVHRAKTSPIANPHPCLQSSYST